MPNMITRIPVMVLHSFKACHSGLAHIINTVIQPYDHKEHYEFSIGPFDSDIPYASPLKHG
jgi:hypothetical protein